MTIVGINQNMNSEGECITTLHVVEEFPTYYSKPEAGRRCVGQKVDTIYAGNHDCSGLKVGMNIDVLYDKAITTKSGTFQTIKRIDIINK